MSERTQQSDLGIGLAVAFGALAVLGALATTASSYISSMNHSALMQTVSGVSVGLAMLFGAIAIAVLHIYG
ncbi:hypothetical protein ACKVMT_04485 [Halobacteriales archaeon Cl-PHB]